MNEPVDLQPASSFLPMSRRFRGYLPVVVDVETGGFDWNKHALLEIACVPIEMDAEGRFFPGDTASAHLVPAPGLEIDPKSLEITGIAPTTRSASQSRRKTRWIMCSRQCVRR